MAAKTAAAPKAPSQNGAAKTAKSTPAPSRSGQTNAAVNIQPLLNQQQNAPAPTQRYGTVAQRLPIGLSEATRQESVTMLNQLLADTITLRDMYKKHHWQVVGPTFNQLHLMYDKHYEAQVELVDAIAERIQTLGGVSLAMAADVAEATRIPRPPKGREPASVQLSRLIDAHTMIL